MKLWSEKWRRTFVGLRQIDIREGGQYKRDRRAQASFFSNNLSAKHIGVYESYAE